MGKIFNAILSVCLVTGLQTAGAQAADYPDQPFKLVVSYGPGGATDFQARIVTEPAETYLGEQILVINKPGAGGQVGWNWVIKSGTRDGYTLSAYNLPHMIAQSLVLETAYTPENMIPIANWGADPAVLIVAADSPFQTVADLLDAAREDSVQLSGAGLYTGHHIAALQLAKASGADLTFVPSPTGGAEALRLVQAGHIAAGFNNLSDSYRAGDALRILAIADTKRNAFLPDVPTFMELGYDIDDTSVNMRGIAVPEGVAPDRIAVLAPRVVEMFSDPHVAARMKVVASPMHVLNRDAVVELFKRKKAVLSQLLRALEGE